MLRNPAIIPSFRKPTPARERLIFGALSRSGSLLLGPHEIVVLVALVYLFAFAEVRHPEIRPETHQLRLLATGGFEHTAMDDRVEQRLGLRPREGSYTGGLLTRASIAA